MGAKSDKVAVRVSGRLLERLARLALPEQWAFGDDELGMLERYLASTFARVVEQNKAVVGSDRFGSFAALCTGLVDGSFDDVLCVCEPNEDEQGKYWEAKAFCVMGRSRYGRRLQAACGDVAPPKATYFDGELSLDALSGAEIDYRALAGQASKLTREALEEMGGDDQAMLDEALHVAVEVARARILYTPRCVLPGWGPAIGLEGAIHCVPLSLSDPMRIDAALALEQRTPPEGQDVSYRARRLLSLEEAWLAARVVRVPDVGTGWGVAKKLHSLTKDEAPMPETRTWEPKDARARLTCKDVAVPPFVVRSGDTVGIVRRKTAERPRIALPSLHGFEGVSHIQGRFLARAEDVWEYVHEGSNWTLVRHADGTERVLRQQGARERLVYGDVLVFSGSPSFVLGR